MQPNKILIIGDVESTMRFLPETSGCFDPVLIVVDNYRRLPTINIGAPDADIFAFDEVAEISKEAFKQIGHVKEKNWLPQYKSKKNYRS